MARKKVIVAIFLLIAFILALYLDNFFHFKIDFIFASLIAAMLFLDFGSFLLFLLFSMALLAYQPAIGLEMVVILVMALLFYYLKKYSPFEKIINFLIIFSLFFLIFYSLNYQALLKEFNVFIIDFILSLIFGLLEFMILLKIDRAYEKIQPKKI